MKRNVRTGECCEIRGFTCQNPYRGNKLQVCQPEQRTCQPCLTVRETDSHQRKVSQGYGLSSFCEARKLLPFCFSVFLLLFCDANVTRADPVEFNRDIRPILSHNCFQCHGPDKKKRKAKLRLDTEAGFYSERNGAPPVVPGKPSESELYRRISTNDLDDRMPPPESKHTLTPLQLDLFRKWIEQGGKWQKHWSLIPPKRPGSPALKNENWPKSLLDSFILARLERDGLQPSPEADREVLLRRVSLDLNGMPPTLEEIDSFLADKSSNAYEKVVDRLLRSTRYGERMSTVWLDIARYADTHGYSLDDPRMMWRWREWVINAFNGNMPYDRFIIDQVAGDLLPDATDDQQIATGFNRNHSIQSEGGIIDEEFRVEYVADRVNVTATAFLGLTMKCARCHDHKYDPITQKDFYRFFAFFNNIPERGRGSGRGNNAPFIRTPSTSQQKRLDDLQAQIMEAKTSLDKLQPAAEDMQKWEKELAAKKAVEWAVLDPVKFTSTGGATLKKLEDLSVLASGKNPAKDNYDVVLRTDKTGITGIRLEALIHDSLPFKGPGRAKNANLVLSEFEAQFATAAEPQKLKKIQFSKARADHYQKNGNYRVEYAIDGKIDSKLGWAVEGYKLHENRTAIFIPSAPIGREGGTELRIRMRFKTIFANHAIGRFRLAITTDKQVEVYTPSEILNIVGKPAEKRTSAEKAKLRKQFLENHSPEAKQLAAQIEKLKKKEQAIQKAVTTTMVMQEMPKPRDAFILQRGEYDQRGEKVQAGVPPSLPPMGNGASKNRLGLAKWMVQPGHPLTARVAVNRFWQMVFGSGIVKTTEDLGSQGEWPSHPDLLDWLALEFVESGWDVKALLKRIVMSSTYRQASAVNPGLLERDPENRLLARGPRIRLSAEMIRDQALAVSGLLVEKIGGPSVKPYHPVGLWKAVDYGGRQIYRKDTGEGLYRRSMYTFWKRSVPPAPLQTFDAPSREACTVRRSRTNTPLQALILMNDPTYVEASRFLAQRMMKEGGEGVDSRISYAFRLVLNRRPKDAERNLLVEIFQKRTNDFQNDKPAASKLLAVGDTRNDSNLDPGELAAYTTVASILLNLDETITKN